MIKAKIKQFLDRLDRNSVTFDPSTLKDEIALKTSWSPANTGGANFGSHRLKQVSDQRIEFRVKKRLMMIAYIFIFCGLGVMAMRSYRDHLITVSGRPKRCLTWTFISHGCYYNYSFSYR